MPNKNCFLLLLSLIAEDVCVWMKTLSPAIWMPSIRPSSEESRRDPLFPCQPRLASRVGARGCGDTSLGRDAALASHLNLFTDFQTLLCNDVNFKPLTFTCKITV